MGPTPDNEAVLEIKDLQISYETRWGDVPAVRGVDFKVRKGETLGIVGESGCGKSTISYGILNFLGRNGKVTGGSIKFMGQEMVGLSKSEFEKIRGNQISMVYQDPMQALNPSLTIGTQLAEVLITHQRIPPKTAWEKCINMLKRVYMPDPGNVMNRFPHMISGGQQQRVVIAMALLNNPKLLIMDEPTTALDVTVEAAVLDLVEDLKKDFNTGIIFITHNLGVVARISNSLCVMYAGEMVEKGPIETIFKNPAHPYTRGLLCCVPRLSDDLSFSRLWSIRGRVPHPRERSSTSCIFAPRCDWKISRCDTEHPQLVSIPGSLDHRSRCFMGADTLKIGLHEYARGKRALLQDLYDDEDQSYTKDILAVDNLKIYYEQQVSSLKRLVGMGKNEYVKAVDGISLKIRKGATIGIVGESGCGKSTFVKGIIGLESPTDGRAELMGIDITHQKASKRDFSLIKELQMVFQNPDSTLNPSYTVGRQIARPLKKFKAVSGKGIRKDVEALLRKVKLAQYYYDRYPRQLSGGEKQRIGIARAIACQPNLIICDEPVSALDVSVQASVLNLLNEIKDEFGSTFIFIAHDLSVVRFISDFIAVMYLGQIVEFGSVEDIYPPPYHPYTEALLSAIPIPDPNAGRRVVRLSGDVPSPLNPPVGCHFHTRCPRRRMAPENGAICARMEPPVRKVKKGHTIRCHIPIEKLSKISPVVNVGNGKINKKIA